MQQAEKWKHLFLVNKIHILNLLLNNNRGLVRYKYELFVEENLNFLLQYNNIRYWYNIRVALSFKKCSGFVTDLRFSEVCFR